MAPWLTFSSRYSPSYRKMRQLFVPRIQGMRQARSVSFPIPLRSPEKRTKVCRSYKPTVASWKLGELDPHTPADALLMEIALYLGLIAQLPHKKPDSDSSRAIFSSSRSRGSILRLCANMSSSEVPAFLMFSAAHSCNSGTGLRA